MDMASAWSSRSGLSVSTLTSLSLTVLRSSLIDDSVLRLGWSAVGNSVYNGQTLNEPITSPNASVILSLQNPIRLHNLPGSLDLIPIFLFLYSLYLMLVHMV